MRRILTLATGAAVALAMSLVGAPSALASASGVEYFDAFDLNAGGQTIPIPSGQVGHTIEGSGTNITYEDGRFLAAKPICNWQIVFSYRDVERREYLRDPGPLHSDCNGQGGYTKGPGLNLDVQPGVACAQLYSNGGFIAEQCHSITRN